LPMIGKLLFNTLSKKVDWSWYVVEKMFNLCFVSKKKKNDELHFVAN
jgi:hypothetical protein